MVWSTYPTASNEYGWSPGAITSTFNNVDNSGTDISISFEGETSKFGFWAGQTPKVGSQSSYIFKGLDLLTNGFENEGITCNINFSKPVYAVSFDIHHINFYDANGDKYIITGVNGKGETIYPEFTQSQYPTYTTDNSTGTVNAVANLTSGVNPLVAVNFSSDDLIKSIKIEWLDCDDCSPNKPHATGIGNFSFCMPQALGFDGVDDYVSRDSFLGGLHETTMMAWVKPEKKSNKTNIIGQANCYIFIDDNKTLKSFVKTELGKEIQTPDLENATIKDNIWSHVALSYNGHNGNISLYLNGEEIWHYSSERKNTSLFNSEDWNADYDFEIGRHPKLQNNFFKGSINECRVYSKSLTQDQLQQQIYQKIAYSNGKVIGDIIPLEIHELNWNDILLYYEMNPSNLGDTQDLSNYTTNGKLHNMDIFQDYNAPLPYATKSTSSGSWTNLDNWVNGEFWDITNMPDYAIIKTNGNLNIEEDINLLGLIVNHDSSVNVKNNSGLFSSTYLRLDGELYLEGNSQLIQLEGGVLDPKSSGILKKDIYGTADTYTYDYWSSPVGAQNSDDNNQSYSVDDIFEEVTFLENGYDGLPIPLSIADYWIWKFCNTNSDYFTSWHQVRSAGLVNVGEGFTMKGPGSGTVKDKQKYTLKGKPNNATVTRNVTLGNDYLLGNPYPSAIDAEKFLMDNKEVSSGTIYFWQHWGGDSHTASDYQGGYAAYSLAGEVPAVTLGDIQNEAMFSNLNSVDNKFIPPGKGFYVSAMKNGSIEFNNSQRVFHIAEDTSTNENAPRKIEYSKEEDNRLKIRIRFNSPNNLNRQLLLTVDEKTSQEVDWGYDSKNIDSQIDDMYWMIDDEKYVIQAINNLSKSTIIPIGIHINKAGFNTVLIDDVENKQDDLDIYIFDIELNEYHDLSKSEFKIFLDKGTYLNRFELRFSNNSATLSIIENKNEALTIYFSKTRGSLIVENINSLKIKSLEMYTILGQSLFQIRLNTNKKSIQYKIPKNISGNYIVKINTDTGSSSKKISVN
ncbi:MAG: LamG-like jellyroll fold domain-containing protein [Jejuia sp.]